MAGSLDGEDGLVAGSNHRRRFAQGLSPVWVLPLLMALWVISPVTPGAGGTAAAQLSDDDTTSTQGTQFVTEPDKPKPPEPPTPPKQAVPTPTAVPKPLPPKSQAPKPLIKEPPRYPSVIFLVDTSDSMLNRIPGRGKIRLAEAKAALIQVLGGMSRETRVQLWAFNTDLRPMPVPGVRLGEFVPVGKGKNRALLVDQVRRLRTSGGTNLYRSIIKALRFFAHPADQEAYRSGKRFPVLVVLSDGEDGGKTRENLATVQKVKKTLPLVTLNAIGFHIGQGKWFKTLCRIATHPKGCATVDDESQLQKMLESFYRPRRTASR